MNSAIISRGFYERTGGIGDSFPPLRIRNFWLGFVDCCWEATLPTPPEVWVSYLNPRDMLVRLDPELRQTLKEQFDVAALERLLPLVLG